MKLRREERSELLRTQREINELRSLLMDAYRSFNCITDPYLLEACIYEINALQAKYCHALRKAKAQ